MEHSNTSSLSQPKGSVSRDAVHDGMFTIECLMEVQIPSIFDVTEANLHSYA